MITALVGASALPIRLCSQPSSVGGFLIQIGDNPVERVTRDAAEKFLSPAVVEAVAKWPGTWHDIEDEPRADAASVPAPASSRLDADILAVIKASLPPLEYLYREDEPRPHRFIVQCKGDLSDARLLIRVQRQNCRVKDDLRTMVIDCPACERIALVSHLTSQGFRFTEENAAGDESRPAA